jgi:hypothetical protein
MMFTLVILTGVMGAVFAQLDHVQKRYKAEEVKLDVTQESREFLDQIVRDLRNAGYPTARMFASGVLRSPRENDYRNAVGLVKFAYDDLWFEGDVDGDGQVDSIRYTLVPDADGNCPCAIRRSEVVKLDATAPMSQTTSYSTELDGVLNSAASGGSGSNGSRPVAGTTPLGSGSGIVMRSNQALYGNYAPYYVFVAYDGNGNVVAPCDIVNSPSALQSISTISITINVLARPSGIDLQTRMRPALSITASAKIG